MRETQCVTNERSLSDFIGLFFYHLCFVYKYLHMYIFFVCMYICIYVGSLGSLLYKQKINAKKRLANDEMQISQKEKIK